MIHDVAILGAGPCGLAVAARLREPYPSALFTDIEHARFWNRKHDINTIDNEVKARKSKFSHLSGSSRSRPDCDQQHHNYSLIIFDAHSSTWLSSWRSKFDMLRISHLRSPLFFHPDPKDRDGLLAFAYEQGREKELCEISGVVGREVSKHARKKRRKRAGKGRHVEGERQQSARHLHLDNRDQNDYFTPSASLFEAYVDSIVYRYDLANLVHHSEIVDISYDYTLHSSNRLFTLTTSTGQTHLARTVVLATGPANTPQIPPSCPLLTPPKHHGSAVHVFDPTQPLIPDTLLSKLNLDKSPPTDLHPQTQIAIVGGGLTSAQLTDFLLSDYAITQIHLILRKPLRTKHFDVSLPWVSKLRNREMATFWSADTDEERFEMLKTARGGGSVTPPSEARLRRWEKKGRLVVYTGWEIDAKHHDTRWNNERDIWENITLKHSSTTTTTATIAQPPPRLRQISHIIFATSTPPSIHTPSFLHTLLSTNPIPTINSLPVPTQDLTWSDQVPLFITGALAGLRLGPGAGNLAGARLGAERVAWGIEKVMMNRGWCDRDDYGGNCEKEGSRRDSGYASVDYDDDAKDDTEKSDASIVPNETGSVTTKPSQENHADLVSSYIAGIGNRFEGLSLIDDQEK